MPKSRRSSRPIFVRITIFTLLAVSILALAALAAIGSDDVAASEPFGAVSFMTTEPNAEEARLFELIGESKTESLVSTASVREQEITINFEDVDFESANKLSFPLLDGRSYEAIRNVTEGFERFEADEFTWRGKVVAENDFSGDVIFSFKGKALSGLIYSPAAVYEIIPQADLRHSLVQLDQSRFSACGGAINVDEPTIADDGLIAYSDRSLGVDDGSQIDVLVTYTALVRQALGGTAQAQAFAQQAIASTNTAYINSNITPRVRLVGTMETSYDEAAGTLSAALPWVRANAEVAAVRNIVKADLVSMVIQNASDACGIGYLMTTVGPSFESNGFSAVARSCAVGNLSFAHELGHNQAAHHNPENAGTAAYPYAYGHYVDDSFRTVMSYVNQCPNGCSRVPHFSNPAISFNGFPTGIAEERDNHRTLDNTALTISQFRDGLVATLTPTTTPTPGNSTTPTNTPTRTATNTPTRTSTNTPTRTSTNTPTNTATSTPSSTPTASIRGTVTYGNTSSPPVFISNALVTGTGNPVVTATTSAGQYALTGFGSGSYTVSLQKDTEINAITSNDAARIAQHVAGTSTLPTNSARVAADVTNNDSLSSQDAAKLAQFVAGLPNSPPNLSGIWRFFVAPGPTFPVGASPMVRTYGSVLGSFTGQDYVGLLAGEVTGNWVSSAARPKDIRAREIVTVALPSTSLKVQEEIRVPISIDGVANKNVISYEFDLEYDPSIIVPMFDPVDVAGTASRGLTVVTNVYQPGRLRVVVYGALPIDRDGVLMNLRFKVLGIAGSMSSLSFKRIMFNEGEPRADVINGHIQLD